MWLRGVISPLYSLCTLFLSSLEHRCAGSSDCGGVLVYIEPLVKIDLHFVRDRVAIGDVRVLHVPTTSQFADIFTKGLPSSTFSQFRSSLNVAGG